MNEKELLHKIASIGVSELDPPIWQEIVTDARALVEKVAIQEIVKKRLTLEREMLDLDAEYAQKKGTIQKKFRELFEDCPHKNMNSASYTRWCNDCGKSWDTT